MKTFREKFISSIESFMAFGKNLPTAPDEKIDNTANKTIATRKLKHGATTLSEEKTEEMKSHGAKFKGKK